MVFLLIVTLAIATVSAGIVAGYVFAYANSVMPGLAEVDDRVFVVANQRLNARVENPVFFAVSTTPVIALLIATGTAAFIPNAGLVLGACVLALAAYGGGMAVTFTINVPLNRALIALRNGADANALRSARVAFERPWARANRLRTWLMVLALAGTTTALALTVMTPSARI